MAEVAAKPDTTKVRPERPDEEKYKKDVSEAEKVWKASQEKFQALKARLNGVDPKQQNKDNPAAKRQQELRAELKEIKEKQSGNKTSRTGTQEKINALQTQLQSRINEQKNNRAKISYKTVEEIDKEISRLDKQVESGQMKIVDEKKALAEISSLRKLKKNFATFDSDEKNIADLKSKIDELKKSTNNPEAKALSDRYNVIIKELDEIKASQDETYKNLNALRDEKTKLNDDQQTKYMALKAIKDDYYNQSRAYKDYEREQAKARNERRKAENEAYANEKRKKAAAERLEEASAPAYTDEIMTAEGLIHYFDPSSVPEAKPLRGPSGFAAESQRTVDDSPMKGTIVKKKEDRDDTYFAGTGGKKGKKNKAAVDSGKFNLGPGLIEQLAKVNVDPPTKQSDVPEVIEKLKAKVSKWKADSPAKTKENIAKAQAEIDRLEKDAANGETEGSSEKKLNGKPSANASSADDLKNATKDLEAAKIED